jgi:cytidine deaminase
VTSAPASEPRWTDRQQELLARARSAALAAYCPYSKFRVGAAVSAGGRIYTGCNVENASYSLTICAERAAIFNAVAAGNRQIDMIAIACIDAAPDSAPSTRMPCGACRQVMAEFARSDIAVLVDGVGQPKLSELLPAPFALAQQSEAEPTTQ